MNRISEEYELEVTLRNIDDEITMCLLNIKLAFNKMFFHTNIYSRFVSAVGEFLIE